MTTPPVIAQDPLAACPPLPRWIIERATFDDEALALVQPAQSLEHLYAGLVQAALWPSAIRLIASVLPARESVWWAWVSARHATQLRGAKPPTAGVHNTLTAIEQWIVQPDDAHRRAAWAAGEASGLDTPVGMVAAAVFLSGTTIAPPHAPVVPPPPGAALPLISGAILVAGGSSGDATQIAPTLAAFAAQGIEIVKRLGGWDTAAQVAHDTHHRLAQEYTRLTASPSGT
jgi:hypothetical protein